MKCILISGFLLLGCATTYSQDSLKTLNEVIVTATKTPVKQSETGKVVNVITAAELQKSSGKSLGQLLNQQPGMIINGADNNLGTNQTIYTRGASAGNTLILLDGVPFNDASGISSEFDLNNFSLENVQRIEILKGAQSTLYGSDAVAGVINIISKKSSQKPLQVNAGISAGSYETYKATVALSGNNGKGQMFFVSYNGISSRGFSSAYDSTGKAQFDRDGFHQDAFQASYGFRASKNLNVRLFGKYNNNRSDLDAGAFIDDKDYTNHNDNTIAGTSADYKLKNGFIRLQYSYNRFNRSFVDDSTDLNIYAKYQKGKYFGTSNYAEMYTNLHLASFLELLAGADYRTNATSQSYLSLPDYGFPSVPVSADSANTQQISAYASLILKTSDGFHTEAGGRWNHHSVYGSNFTYSFNPFFLKNEFKFFANISSGYHVPSLYQLYSEFGNKNLKPEVSNSYEAGAQYLKKNINARVSVFARDIRQVFYFYTDPATYASRYINADKQKDYGVEAEVTASLCDKISVSANYTYVDGKISTTDFSGKDTSFFNLYKRPANVLNLSVNYQPVSELFFSARLKTASKAFEPGFPAPYELKGYYTAGLYMQYQYVKKYTVYADLDNIMGEKYFVTRGFTTKGFNINAGIKVAL